jgi:hypothetical protein
MNHKQIYFNMPVKNQITNEEFLRNVELPEQTKSYTVISHGEIMDRVKETLNSFGFYIKNVTYTYSFGGEVAFAQYDLTHSLDSDIGMTFNWSNSYNKKLRFGCYIGGFIFENGASFIGTNGVNWLRKHTGTANEEAHEVIEQVINYAEEFFNNLIVMKKEMLATEITQEKYASILGELYFIDQLITSSQASAVIKNKNEFKIDRNNLWGLYKDVMNGLKGTDITKWQQQQQKVHHILESFIASVPDYLIIDITEPKTQNLLNSLNENSKQNEGDIANEDVDEEDSLGEDEEDLTENDSTNDAPDPYTQKVSYLQSHTDYDTDLIEFYLNTVNHKKNDSLETICEMFVNWVENKTEAPEDLSESTNNDDESEVDNSENSDIFEEEIAETENDIAESEIELEAESQDEEESEEESEVNNVEETEEISSEEMLEMPAQLEQNEDYDDLLDLL